MRESTACWPGRSVAVMCGDQLVAALIAAGVGVVSSAAPLYLGFLPPFWLAGTAALSLAVMIVGSALEERMPADSEERLAQSNIAAARNFPSKRNPSSTTKVLGPHLCATVRSLPVS